MEGGTACDLQGYGHGCWVSRMRSFSGCGLTSGPTRSWWQPGRASICRAAAGGAVGAAGALTGVRGGGAGGRWMLACSRRSWRQTRLGCVARSMGWWSPRCPGRGMGRGIRGRLTTRPRGWPRMPPSRPCGSCCGPRGRRWVGSWRGWLPMLRRPAIGSRGCGGSGSTRSATRRATATSWSWWIMTADGWCGPRPAATRRPCAGSLTCSARSVATSSGW